MGSIKEQLVSILYKAVALGGDLAAHESQRKSDPQEYDVFTDFVSAQVDGLAVEVGEVFAYDVNENKPEKKANLDPADVDIEEIEENLVVTIKTLSQMFQDEDAEGKMCMMSVVQYLIDVQAILDNQI